MGTGRGRALAKCTLIAIGTHVESSFAYFHIEQLPGSTSTRNIRLSTVSKNAHSGTMDYTSGLGEYSLRSETRLATFSKNAQPGMMNFTSGIDESMHSNMSIDSPLRGEEDSVDQNAAEHHRTHIE